MAEQLTRHERIALGQKAERLIEEIGSHIQSVEAKYHDEWARAKDAPTREFLWVKLQALTDVVRDITAKLNDGLVAVREQENEDGPN